MVGSQGWMLLLNTSLSLTTIVKEPKYQKQKAYTGELTHNKRKNPPKVTHLVKIKRTMKQWSRNQFSTTLKPDHQTLLYPFIARTIAVGPFRLSCFQTHITSLGCFMYPGAKLHSANACFQIYISAARSHLDVTQAWVFGIRRVKGGKRRPHGGAGKWLISPHTICERPIQTGSLLPAVWKEGSVQSTESCIVCPFKELVVWQLRGLFVLHFLKTSLFHLICRISHILRE